MTTLTTVAAEPEPQARVRVVEPRLSPTDRYRLQIIWGAALLLTIFCYATMLITIRSVRGLRTKIDALESSLGTLKSDTEKANASISAAMLILRPWIGVTFEPVRGKDGIYGIVATNRGSSPAQLIGKVDRIGILSDESCLPTTPEFARPPRAPAHSLVLIPGDTALLQTFGQSDLSWLCKSAEQIRRVEMGHDKVFIYGRVIYSPAGVHSADARAYETGWCCRYLHNDSGGVLIESGPHEYRLHT